MSKFSGTVRASWFDPRRGNWSPIGQFPASGTHTFTPLTNGYGQDWVLVLDDISNGYPVPQVAARPGLAGTPFAASSAAAAGRPKVAVVATFRKQNSLLHPWDDQDLLLA